MEDRLLGSQYAIKSTVGSGGMGVVYRAVGTEDGMTYAVKVLRPELARDENFLRRFHNEAEAVTRLSHQNIVRVYDVDMEADPPYIVMEYVDGRTLRQLIDEEAPLAPERAAWFAAEIAAGLAHAHEQGVIHRDVTPRNIKVTPTGAVKVMDFGLAHAADAATLVETRTLMGSVHYLAPEQARGAATDARTDVYALGVLLHELALGKVPFDGDNPVSIVVKHLREPVQPPRERMEELAEELEGIIMRALAKDPGSRFPSAASMERECRLFSVGRWDELTPPPPQDATRVIGSDAIDALRRENGDGGDAPPERSERGEEAQPAPRDRKRTALWVLLSLLLMLGVGVWGAWSWLTVPVVTVPEVEGLSLADAEAALRIAGLNRGEVHEDFNNDLPVNYVVSQHPAAGTERRRGQTVNLTVSLGPELVVVPGVTNRPQREAELALEAAGLGVEVIYGAHSEAPEGTVFQQNPRSGIDVKVGEVVEIWVSQGPPPEEFALPDWRGRDYQNDVRLDIEELDLVVSVSYRLGEYPQGRVLEQDPDAGSQLTAGESVHLVLSQGCEASASRTIEVDGPGDGPWHVEVEIEDSRSTRRVHSQVHSAGAVVPVDLCFVGSSATLSVYYDAALGDQETVHPD